MTRTDVDVWFITAKWYVQPTLLSMSSPPDRPQHRWWYTTKCRRIVLWCGDEVADSTVVSYADPVMMNNTTAGLQLAVIRQAITNEGQNRRERRFETGSDKLSTRVIEDLSQSFFCVSMTSLIRVDAITCEVNSYWLTTLLKLRMWLSDLNVLLYSFMCNNYLQYFNETFVLPSLYIFFLWYYLTI